MAKSRTKRKRRQRGPARPRARGGVMRNMRSGFKGVAGAVTGDSQGGGGGSKWTGTIVTVLLLAAIGGLIASQL